MRNGFPGRKFRARFSHSQTNQTPKERLRKVAWHTVEALESRQLLSTSTWNNLATAAPGWNVNANWSPSTAYPNSASASANMNVDVAVNQTVSLGANITVNALTLGDTAQTGGVGQTETIAAGNSLTFDNGSSGAALTLDSAAVGDVTVQAAVTLSSDLTITNNSSQILTISGDIDTAGHAINIAGSGQIVIDGVISGAGSLTKSGTGLLTITGANTYSGATTITGGTVQVGNGGTSGSLGTGDITNDATLTFFRSDDDSIVQNIAGTGTLIFTGTGVVDQSTYQLDGVDSFTGDIQVVNGTRFVPGAVGDNTDAFPDASGISIASGSQIYISGGTFNTPLALAGPGWTEDAGVLGALRFDGGEWAGPITLSDSATIEAFYGTGNVTGDIAVGANTLTLSVPNVGNLIIYGNLTSTTAGSVIKTGGYTVVLVGDDSGLLGSYTNEESNTFLGATTAGSANAAWIVNDGSLDGFVPTSVNPTPSFSLGSLSGSGGLLSDNVANDGATVSLATFNIGALNTSTSYAGVVIDTLGGGGTTAINKVGAGTQTLSGASTYTGGTTVTDGTLLFDATGSTVGPVEVDSGGTLLLDASGSAVGPVDVDSGGTLAGIGTANGTVTVHSGGTLSPGLGGTTGILTTDDLILESGSALDVTINSTTPGSGYDQVDVNGSATITGSTLALAGTQTSGATADYDIIATLLTVTGSFSGSSPTLNGVTYTPQYLPGAGAGAELTTGPALIYKVLLGYGMPGVAVFTNTDTLHVQYRFVQAFSPVDAVNEALAGTIHSDRSALHYPDATVTFPTDWVAVRNDIPPVDKRPLMLAERGLNLQADGSYTGWVGFNDDTNIDINDNDYNDRLWAVTVIPVSPFGSAGVVGQEESTGSVVVGAFHMVEASGGEFSAVINWGDGTTSAGTITAGSGDNYVVTGDHTYTLDGVDVVTTEVKDNGDAGFFLGSYFEVRPNQDLSRLEAPSAPDISYNASLCSESETLNPPSGLFSVFGSNSLSYSLSQSNDIDNQDNSSGMGRNETGGSASFTISSSGNYAPDGSTYNVQDYSLGSGGSATLTLTDERRVINDSYDQTRSAVYTYTNDKSLSGGASYDWDHTESAPSLAVTGSGKIYEDQFQLNQNDGLVREEAGLLAWFDSSDGLYGNYTVSGSQNYGVNLSETGDVTANTWDRTVTTSEQNTLTQSGSNGSLAFSQTLTSSGGVADTDAVTISGVGTSYSLSDNAAAGYDVASRSVVNDQGQRDR